MPYIGQGFARLLWGPWVDFVSGSGVYGKKISLVVSLILAFDNFEKSFELVIKQIILSPPQ